MPRESYDNADFAESSVNMTQTLKLSFGDAGVVGGRYRLGEHLGSGGSGEVYEATDLATENLYAIKLLFPRDDRDRRRFGREVAALRQLDVPGVVRLVDEGQDQEISYIVMQKVEGAPFPGEGRSTWEEIQAPALALFDTLARVHALGWVHRDLKPSNILVDAAGRATLLDFGLTWGPSLGTRLTSQSTVLGTPYYLAPEQISGGNIDSRTDLYSAGVVLYEALSGRLPHDESNIQDLFSAKLVRTPRPLTSTSACVSQDVSDLLQSLLSLEPDARPISASVTLQLLGDRGLLEVLPLLGRDLELERLVGAVGAGRSCCVWGPGGCGKTRLVDALEERLSRESMVVGRATAGHLPFQSIDNIVAKNTDHNIDLGELTQQVSRALLEFFSHGVCIVDDVELDRWSRELLLESSRSHAVVWTGVEVSDAAQEQVQLGALQAAQLEQLFEGPDLLFHLREDAARHLFERTSGNPRSVMQELRAWQRWGIAEKRGGLFHVSRAQLDRLDGGLYAFPVASPSTPSELLDLEFDELLAWIQVGQGSANLALLEEVTKQPRWQIEALVEELVGRGHVRVLRNGQMEALLPSRSLRVWDSARHERAHRAFCDALAPGQPSRLLHLMACDQRGRITEEVRAVLKRVSVTGALGQAEAAVREGLIAVRAATDPVGEKELLAQWTRAAFADGSPGILERTLEELRSSSCAGQRWVQVIEAAVLLGQGAHDQAREMILQLGELEDPGLELWKHSVLWQATIPLGVEAEEEVLRQIPTSDRDGTRTDTTLKSWWGLLRYRQGRYLESAQLSLEAARVSHPATACIGATTNAAAAFLEIPDLAKARVAAEQALHAAREVRWATHEARAMWLVRAIDYRAEAALRPWPEFVDAVELLERPPLLAQVLLTEAAIGWRLGENRIDWSRKADAIWSRGGATWPAYLARALSLQWCETEDVDIEAFVTAIESCPAPGLAVQTLGLLGRAGRLRAGDAARLDQLLARLPAGGNTRREILTLAEAQTWVRNADPNRSP